MFGHSSPYVPYILSAVDVCVSLVASGHVLLFKRDTRAAIGWIGLIWLSPILGAILYILLGINRVNRAGSETASSKVPSRDPSDVTRSSRHGRCRFRAEVSHLGPLVHLVDQVAPWPLLAGNEVEPLHGGEQAYPAMVRAIDEATRSVALCTYILDNDRAGQLFLDALGRAVRRGIEVRVLIDDLGARHAWPSMIRSLRNAGIPVARFHPTLAPGWFPYLNLRNHRKILVVDGLVGFTGGMNILEDYLAGVQPLHLKHDLHFSIRGPAVSHLQQVFTDDWTVCTGERLEGDVWFPPTTAAGAVLARGVIDGPDDDRDNLLKVILGALACAKSSVVIATPYFLPDTRIISALEVAALRGVEIDILLPSQNNQILVEWASKALLREILEAGCRVWYSPPPFDHTKLMVVDRNWIFIGSTNWDPRSLRLNFEFNLECYGRELATRLDQSLRDKLLDAMPVTTGHLESRSLPVKLRDGLARLLSLYL